VRKIRMEFLDAVVNLGTLLIVLGGIAFLFRNSVAQVRPTQRCIVERFGKFRWFSNPGLVICIPGIEKYRLINVTEQMVTCRKQEVITGDNLNAGVSAQVYYKIKGDEESVKSSQYNVNDVNDQIVSLAQTTLRNVIGGLTLKDANSKRSELNTKLQEIIAKETRFWGIEVVRCEIAEIEAPNNVQEAMNKIVMAESEKRAAIDFATAVETKADGEKRAAVKEAEGRAKAITIEADAKAEAIKTVNEAANNTFIGPSVDLKKLEVAEQVFRNNSKVIIPEGSSVTALITDLAGVEKVLPLPTTAKAEKK